jgi:hypothetical protein
LTRLQITNGCDKEKKKQVTAAKQTPLPKEPPVQNAVIEPEMKQVSTPEMDIQIKVIFLSLIRNFLFRIH